MSCSICGLNICNCGQTPCIQADCEDPGMIPVGRHLPILDYKFCEKRLENVTGFLVAYAEEGATPQILFTPEPCIPIPILEVNLGDEISHINASLGDTGCMRRLVPGDSTDGWLRAINGKWVVSALPSENLPDPFETENLIVTDTATIENLVVGATMCFDALPAGTIETYVGLSAGNCLVTGTISQVEAALFYESASLTSASKPNDPTARNTNLIFGNEIFDPQSIASVVSTTRIKIDKAGSYFIIWTGFYDRDGAQEGDDGIDLVINSAIVAFSSGRAEHLNAPNSVNPMGIHLATLSVNDTIELRTTANSHLNNNHVQDVKMVLIKYR